MYITILFTMEWSFPRIMFSYKHISVGPEKISMELTVGTLLLSLYLTIINKRQLDTKATFLIYFEVTHIESKISWYLYPHIFDLTGNCL
jgi:hypothetical protein